MFSTIAAPSPDILQYIHTVISGLSDLERPSQSLRDEGLGYLGVYISPVLEKELYDPGPVVSGGQVEGGGLPPVARVTVHVQRRQQRHQLLLVTCTPKN